MPVKKSSLGSTRSKTKAFAKPRKSTSTGHKSFGASKGTPPEQRRIRIPVVGGGGMVKPRRKAYFGGRKPTAGCLSLWVIALVSLVTIVASLG